MRTPLQPLLLCLRGHRRCRRFRQGRAADWRYAAEQFVKILPDKVIAHRSECNPLRLAFDGLDKMRERLDEEESNANLDEGVALAEELQAESALMLRNSSWL